MPNDMRNDAVEIMHASTEPVPERRTFVCFGVARGGTSAVAGTMHQLGIFMGHDLPNNYEDQEFIGKPPRVLKETISARSAKHAIWGWKFPAAANYLEALMPELENPRLIIVYRDLIATMKAHRRLHSRGTELAIHEIMLQQQKNWFLSERWKVPTALISYEKIALYPGRFLEQIADFLGVDQPDEAKRDELIAFLQPGSYK